MNIQDKNLRKLLFGIYSNWTGKLDAKNINFYYGKNKNAQFSSDAGVIEYLLDRIDELETKINNKKK